MIDSVYNYKTVVEALESIETKNIEISNLQEFHDEDKLTQIIREAIEDGFDFNTVRFQPGLGKSHGGAYHIFTELKEYYEEVEDEEDDGPIYVYLAENQSLLYQFEQKLIELGLEKEYIQRIQGFQRIYQHYPAIDVEGELIEKPQERWKSIDIAVFHDYQLGVRNWKIHQKYVGNQDGKESAEQPQIKLDSSYPPMEQFNDLEGKAILIPFSYLGLGMREVEELLSDAEAIFVDEAAKQPKEHELDTEPAKIKSLFQDAKEEHEKHFKEALRKATKHFDISVKELESEILEEDGCLHKTGVLYSDLLESSSIFEKDIQDLVSDTVGGTSSNERKIISPFRFIPDREVDNQILYHISKAFNNLRTQIYKNNNGGYEKYFSTTGKLNQIKEFKEWIDWNYATFQERITRHKSGKAEFKVFRLVEETDRSRKGFLIHEGRIKPFLQLKDRQLIKDQLEPKGDLFISHPVGNSYLRYEKPIYLELLEESEQNTLFMLDATAKRKFIVGMLVLYAYHRRQKLNVNRTIQESVLGYESTRVKNWDDIKKRLNRLDKYIISELGLVEPYIPVFDDYHLKNPEECIEDAKPNIWKDEDTWTPTFIESDYENSDSTIEVLRYKYSNNDGSCTKRSDFIKNMAEGDIPPQVIEAGKQGYSVISFKGVVDKLKENTEVFDNSNTAYHYGSRGQDHLKGDSLLVIGTPYIPPPLFRKKVRKWFGIKIDTDSASMNDEGWWEYNSPLIQAMNEMWTLDEQYQMIHRARPLTENVEILVMGRLPPRVKEELSVKTNRQTRTLKEKVIEEKKERIKQNYGFEKLRKDAINEGVKVEDLDIQSEFCEDVMGELARDMKGVKYDKGKLSLDGRFNPENLLSHTKTA